MICEIFNYKFFQLNKKDLPVTEDPVKQSMQLFNINFQMKNLPRREVNSKGSDYLSPVKYFSVSFTTDTVLIHLS